MTQLLVLALTAPMLGALATLLAGRPRMAVGGTAVAAGASVGVLAGVATGRSATWSIGTAVAVETDRLAALMLVVVTATALVVQHFATRSLSADLDRDRFFVASGVAVSATSLLVVAADLLVAVGAWCATSIAIVVLLGHGGRSTTRAAAGRAARTFVIGDGILLAGAATAVAAAGPITLRPIPLEGIVAADPGVVAGLGVVDLVALAAVVAVIGRTALPPASTWLPTSVAAPTPTSAVLHAGLVGSGAVLAVRTAPLIGAAALATAVAVLCGCAAVAVGSAVMRTRPDVKTSLAWSTVAQMGFVILQVTVGLAGAALLHMTAHGFYKTHRFLGSGSAVVRGRHGADRRVRPAEAVAVVAVAAVVVASAWTVARPDLDPVPATVLTVAVGAAVVRLAVSFRQHRDIAPSRFDRVDLAAVAGLWTMTVGAFVVTSSAKDWLAPSLPTEAPAAALPVALALGATLGLGAALAARTGGDRRPGPVVDRLYAEALHLGDPGRVLPVTDPEPLSPLEARP